MKSIDISVVIPLYNKVRTVRRALESVAAQSIRPLDIVVVDDGSNDGSAAVVETFIAEHPELPIKLVRQPNGGVSVARNRAISECAGEFAALLDADDSWTADHLAESQALIEKYPDCGIYAASFRVDDGRTLTDGDTPEREGVVDFFTESLLHYVVIPSAAVLRRSVFEAAGGFPEGIRMGEDQYLWVKMARLAGVCFSPSRTAVYSKVADNRSSAIYRPETSAFSFAELADSASSESEREYIAKVALGKALVQSVKGGTEDARRAIERFGYTHLNRRALHKLRFVNALPVVLRRPFVGFYNFLAWKLARKGL